MMIDRSIVGILSAEHWSRARVIGSLPSVEQLAACSLSRAHISFEIGCVMLYLATIWEVGVLIMIDIGIAVN
jgi:hypothetical protein